MQKTSKKSSSKKGLLIMLQKSSLLRASRTRFCYPYCANNTYALAIPTVAIAIATGQVTAGGDR
jgi:hypothetical protein